MSVDRITAELEELQETLALCPPLAPAIAQTADLLIATLRGGGKVLTCGNGGSAADALHLAEELVGRYRLDRCALPAICLAADVTAMTCIANDYGFEAVFARPLQALARPGDLLVCFSTSGNSANIIKALETARQISIPTILLCGKSVGKAASLASHELRIPSATGARIQELHTFIVHQWLEAVDAVEWPHVLSAGK